MTTKLRKPAIDPRGHVEKRGPVPASVACAKCEAVRIKSQPWRAPCACDGKVGR